MIRGRAPILTPALEGSRMVIPASQFPRGGFGGRLGPYDPGPPGTILPPLGLGGPGMVMPSERVSVPSLMQRRPIAVPCGQPYPGGRFAQDYRNFPNPTHWDGYMGPGGRPPPLEHQQYLQGIRPRKDVRKKFKHPFPGPKALRRFRHLGYAAWFIEILKSNARKSLSTRPSDVFLFGIILKEIVAALHRIYLNPIKKIYPVLSDIIGPNAYDLHSLVRKERMGVREEAVIIQDFQYILENLMYHITEIMPIDGVLGTHRKSAVFELIRGGKRFPDGYFWEVEMELLQFDDDGRTVNIGDEEALLLLYGIFISRSLVTTILMKPVDYGLSSAPLSNIAERNLRLVATALLYLIRRMAYTRRREIMDMPQEIARYLYSDYDMDDIYKKLHRTFKYCEGLLTEWGREYIRRLRGSSIHAYK